MTAKAPMISFACSGCGRPFTVPASFAGRRATCKTCQTKVVVPGIVAAPAPAAPMSDRATPMGAERPVPAVASRFAPIVPETDAPAVAEHALVPTAPANGKSHGLGHEPPPLIVPAPARVAGSKVAIAPADTGKSPRRGAGVAVISEAQSPPTTASMAAPSVAPEHEPIAPPEFSSDITDRPASPGPAPKVPMRIRRLMVDAEQMAKAFTDNKMIAIKSAVGDPPELYQIEYHVTGLQKGWLGKPKKRDQHLVEIQLTSEYPRMSPKCRMLTPVFHPNIDDATICVGDHWTAGERLVDLVVRIGEMLAYQDYNIKSPLNGEAAMWADLHPKKLPVDSRNLHPGEI